jgi:hypothetical protein
VQFAVGALGRPQTHPRCNPLDRHRRFPPQPRRRDQLPRRNLALGSQDGFCPAQPL